MPSPAPLIRPDLAEVASRLEVFLQQFFQEHAERYAYGELFEPLYLDLTEFVSRRGKRIRPMLLVQAYQAFGGSRPLADRSVLKAAVALELLHAFILVHDDVIDQSERRRGLPTFHKLVEQRFGPAENREKIGYNVAMVVGDMLFALAVETLQSTDFDPGQRGEAMMRFLRYVTDTGCGEVYDILLGARDITRASAEDIERMYLFKTTRYTFEAPIVLGGLLAGARPELLDEVHTITDPLGLAFQIRNDLVEYSHFHIDDCALQTDLLEGKKTLLLRRAYDRLSELDRSFLQLCLSTSRRNDSSILKIRELIDRSGAVADLEAQVQQLFGEAARALAASSFTGPQRDGLKEAVDWVRQQTLSG